GSLVQNLYFIGLAWVSATFATSVYNLIPVITFVFSVLCGYVESSLFTITTVTLSTVCSFENLRTPSGRVKVLGTITGIDGSMLQTFFKGVIGAVLIVCGLYMYGAVGQVKMKKVMQELKPVLLMVLVQLGYASTSILLKFAINDGMSIRVIVAYRHIFGAAFVGKIK
ncbi:hypothetical protein D0Y65_012078, partial [Glycine soja]